MKGINLKLTDEELVELAKKNPDNFEALVVRYQGRLFYFVKRISYFSSEEIEDVLQETFIKVYRNLNGFDRDMKFSTWIYQITRNCAIDAMRKKRVRPQNVQLEDQELVAIFRSSVDIESEAIMKESFNKIKNIINKLPFKYREVMILRFLEEKSYEEIMDIVKKPKGTVAALISRGRKMVAEESKKQEINFKSKLATDV